MSSDSKRLNVSDVDGSKPSSDNNASNGKTNGLNRMNPVDDTNNGRPRYRPESGVYHTKHGIKITREMKKLNYPNPSTTSKQSTTTSSESNNDNDDVTVALQSLIDSLDYKRGALFESAYEYPGRYARWTMGFSDPPLSLETIGRRFFISALNPRGNALLPFFYQQLSKLPATQTISIEGNKVIGIVKEVKEKFSEEERSKQHSVFSIVREIVNMFGTSDDVDPQLGLYGAFGYELTFQFEPIKLKHNRDETQRDMVLYIPDNILVVDKVAKRAWRLLYDFEAPGCPSTLNIPRNVGNEHVPFKPSSSTSMELKSDHEPGEFQEGVKKSIEEFKVGNLFEAVLSQTFSQPCKSTPSQIFKRLRIRNPSPYLFLINLGEEEYLVGASPEMFVRVENTVAGLRVETCPIAGTIQRGADALQDADRIRQIIVDLKEESELTMCTDVDRNDKSRICKPGSVQVIGRRQIEKYSKLIHTVDHVEGYLRDEFDALDAFLVHTWAVTVTGAPKTWSIQFVENNEKSPRKWYSGAIGLVGFDGHMNTGLTLRTVRIKNGVAEVRSGATLLFDSIPENEEKETHLKASALLEVVKEANAEIAASSSKESSSTTSAVPVDSSLHISRKRVLFIDHQDSFVHTLGNYIRQVSFVLLISIVLIIYRFMIFHKFVDRS